MEETIVGTAKIYDGRVVKLAVHDVRLPNDRLSRREVVHHTGAVAIVVLDEKRHVLLVRQFRLPAGKILYEIPAGTLKPQEDPIECAYRELQEETGYKPLNLEALGGIYPAPGYTTEFIHLYYATQIESSSLPMDDDEFVESEWLPLEDALAMIEKGDISDAKTVAGLLRVARRLGL